ncbi:MAG: hypothetical protein IJC80_04600, partial [Clostridia bacterium]|nr:hypothetical protein [Clostridia bacterium]
MTVLIILFVLLCIILIPLLIVVDIALVIFAIMIIISDASIIKETKGKKGAMKMVVDDTMEALDEVTDIKD